MRLHHAKRPSPSKFHTLLNRQCRVFDADVHCQVLCSCTACRAADPNGQGQKISPYAKIAHDKSESQRNSLAGQRGRIVTRTIYQHATRTSRIAGRGRGGTLNLWPPSTPFHASSNSQPLPSPFTQAPDVASGAEDGPFYNAMDIQLQFDDGGQNFTSAPASNHVTLE